MKKDYKIAVAGTGYVGLSIAIPLLQSGKSHCCRVIPAMGNPP